VEVKNKLSECDSTADIEISKTYTTLIQLTIIFVYPFSHTVAVHGIWEATAAPNLSFAAAPSPKKSSKQFLTVIIL